MVSSDLENLEMSGNFDVRRKSQGILFCENQFYQSEHPNFENFLGEHAPRPLLTFLDAHKYLGPLYTTTNSQHIAIYPGKCKFILVKISPDSERLHGRHAKDNQTPVMFFTAGDSFGLPCLHECANTERINISLAMP